MTRNSHRDGIAFVRKNSSPSHGLIAFWGDPLSFSNSVLRLVEAEAGMMEVQRIGRLEELRPGGGERRFILFDDEVAEDLFADPARWMAGQPGARWVLAYRDGASARRLLALRRQDAMLAKVGFLPMGLPVDQWAPMLRLVLSGECFVPARLLDTDAEPSAARNGSDVDIDALLTPREREVLELVAEGKRNKTIAHELGLSEHTIKLHLHNVVTKINVRNRTQAAQWLLTRQYGMSR